MSNELHPGLFIMIEIEGTRLDADTRAFIAKHGIRAVCLFRKNLADAAQARRLTAELRDVLGPEALIAVDHEGGAVQRALFVPEAPSAMCLGAADDPGLAEAVGAAVGRGVAYLGCNWNFAPVLDLNSNPANPGIAERSFGSHGERATELALAWLRGGLSQGVACCVKHFPGHGDTVVDSHLQLPVVDKSAAELAALELFPFRAASSVAPAVMTAHILFPALDAERPATLSPRVLRGLLRYQWGYDGVVITDALNMKAIADRYGQPRGAVMALAAGADMAMVFADRAETERVLHAIAAALRDGTLAREVLDASRRRLAALARRFPAATADYAPEQRAADEALMRRAWAAGVTWLRPGLFPAPGSRIRLVVPESVPGDGVAEAGVGREQVLQALAGIYESDVVSFTHPRQLEWNALPRDGRATILVSTSRARYGEREARTWRPDLHVVLWNPFQALDIAAPAILTYGYQRPALEALNAVLRGAAPATGRFPVTVPAVQGSAA